MRTHPIARTAEQDPSVFVVIAGKPWCNVCPSGMRAIGWTRAIRNQPCAPCALRRASKPGG